MRVTVLVTLAGVMAAAAQTAISVGTLSVGTLMSPPLNPWPYGIPADAMVTVWNVNDGQTIMLPCPAQSGISYNYLVQWGDGTTNLVTTPTPTHTYFKAGKYTNVITGTLQKWCFEFGTQPWAGSYTNLVGLLQFGNTGMIDLSWAFTECINLAGTIPSFNSLTNVQHFEGAFEDCYLLTGTIPNFDNFWRCTNFHGVFFHDYGLGGAVPSLSPLTNITRIDRCFEGMTNLTSVGSFTGLASLQQMEKVFYGCSGITSKYPALTDCTLLTRIDQAFQGTGKFSSTTIAEIFGTNDFHQLTNAQYCFWTAPSLFGNGSDFTGKAFGPSFTVGTNGSDSSIGMFRGQTNLSDWNSLSAAWK